MTKYIIDPYNHTGYSQVLRQVVDTDPNTAYILGLDVLARAQNSDMKYLLYDGHGSVRHLANPTGTIAASYNYDGYGRALNFSPTNAATSLLYAGEMYDKNTQQYYLRARYYSPATGRFNRIDDFSGNKLDPQSLHKYLYAHANPINRIDPTGKFSLVGIVVTIVIAAILLSIPGCKSLKRGRLGRFWKHSDMWAGSTKRVEFRFSVSKGNPKDFCLVNFGKGFVKHLSTGNYPLVRHLGGLVPMDFPDWDYDTVDSDPVYWSNAQSRWNYNKVPGQPKTYSAIDAPNTPAGYQRSWEFKMCIFQTKDVPKDGRTMNAATLMNKAIQCIDWEAKVTHNSSGVITYP